MFDQTAAQVDRVFLFGPFRLSAKKRLLLENGTPVRLGSRAIEMLIILVEGGGELVGKHELTARVWPQTVVVAANLTSQMTALRRALHDGRDANRYILNESGRGYRFVAPVVTVEEPELTLPVALASTTPGHASPSLLRLVELCYGFIGQPQEEQPSPPSEQAAVDAILQRGIRALEFARTLVSAPDSRERSGSETRKAADAGLDVTHYANRWADASQPAAAH